MLVPLLLVLTLGSPTNLVFAGCVQSAELCVSGTTAFAGHGLFGFDLWTYSLTVTFQEPGTVSGFAFETFDPAPPDAANFWTVVLSEISRPGTLPAEDGHFVPGTCADPTAFCSLVFVPAPPRRVWTFTDLPGPASYPSGLGPPIEFSMLDSDLTLPIRPATPTTTTPEPGTLVLLASGLAGLGAVRRRYLGTRRP